MEEKKTPRVSKGMFIVYFTLTGRTLIGLHSIFQLEMETNFFFFFFFFPSLLLFNRKRLEFFEPNGKVVLNCTDSATEL